MSNGIRRSWLKDAYPVPKSSIASRTPMARRVRSEARAPSWSRRALSVVSSTSWRALNPDDASTSATSPENPGCAICSGERLTDM